MKRLLLILGVCTCVAMISIRFTANGAIPLSLPDLHSINASFKWSVTVFDFGKVKVNKPVSHKFTFTNNGDSPLVISSVQASCGCTVADYSKDPIEPGQQGFVNATYNAAHVGVFSKTVTVNANIPDGAVVLTIKGEVTE